jgi:Na+/proline symporter
VEGLELFWKIASMMGIAFWLGLFWRRATVAGAWASTATAFAVWWLTTQSFFVTFAAGLPLSDSLRFVWQGSKGPEVYLPWQMVLYLTTGLAAGILVSLFSKPVSHEKLENFYALIRTPVTPGEDVPAPCTLPKNAVVPPPRKVLPKSGLEIAVPTRSSVIGFLVGWACVAALIAIFAIIVKG